MPTLKPGILVGDTRAGVDRQENINVAKDESVMLRNNHRLEALSVRQGEELVFLLLCFSGPWLEDGNSKLQKSDYVFRIGVSNTVAFCSVLGIVSRS